MVMIVYIYVCVGEVNTGGQPQYLRDEWLGLR